MRTATWQVVCCVATYNLQIKLSADIHIMLDKLASDKVTLQDTSRQIKVGLFFQQSRLEGMHGGGWFIITFGFLGNVSVLL